MPAKKAEAKEKRSAPRPRRKEVAIFGGGIAGLTAAHELVERGYRVEVYEQQEASAIDALLNRECTVGGKAQTQWTCAKRPEIERSPAIEMRSTSTIALEFSRCIVRFGNGASIPNDENEVIDEIAKAFSDNPHVKECEIRGFCDQRGMAPYPNLPRGEQKAFLDERPDYQRALNVAKAVCDRFRELSKRACQVVAYRPDQRSSPRKREDEVVRLYPVPMGLGLRDDWSVDDMRRNYVDFHVIEDWIPGEHGFRFFPSFYRNLGDTMRRTPVAYEGNLYVETASTVRDNIKTTRNQYMAMNERDKSFFFPRRPVKSTQEQFDRMLDMMTAQGYTLDDISRGQAMVVKYMTSCPERRAAECENISWWDYVGGETFSRAFQNYFDATGQTLLAMRTKECDARTYGNITIQMLLDHINPEPGEEDRKTDGTLNGPTSIAWFDHWRRYLERQGVEFYQGKLVELREEEGEIWPVVVLRGGRQRTVILRDYYVVAVGDVATRELCTTGGRRNPKPKFVGRDFQCLAEWKLGYADRARPDGAHQHMSGIQYYFDSDIPFVDGHIDYADAEWGLSAISQPQFWTRQRGWWSGYRGVLSVDICDWFTKSRRLGKAAWDCSPDEIAEEIWHQIKKCVPADLLPHVPDPILYHLDRNVVFRENGQGAVLNRTPFLTNRVGDYPRRPGRPGNYEVHFDRLVLAGDFMQTYTRMTTMEAANESARHAVNAILKRDGFHGDGCSTYNPEEYEPQDLRYLIDLDRKLFEMKMPHMSEITDFSPDRIRETLRRAR